MFAPIDLLRNLVLSMEPEARVKDMCYGPESSHRAVSNGPTQEQHRPHCPCRHVLGQDCLDGQILGQLHPLTEGEEEEGSGATFPGEGATFPEMGSKALRLASFYDWPPTAGVQPELLLAAAGFFHTGQQDKVRCFFCYGCGDDPWTEHFLLQSKGRDFGQSIQACAPLLGSWGQWEEPEDAAPATASAPVHGCPELLESRRETQCEDASEPVSDAQEQLQRLQEERTHKVRLDQAVSIVFVPRGHLVCTECALNLQLCPMCRAHIHSCVRTFLS
uniref:RING-type E3 ubiquitin transferase n=1 Tax=Nannospalax galili TaxID=1026970 RepID=A0A8C6QF59_NANGA